MPSNTITFTTIRTEGALLPPDVLQRIADGDASLGGLTAESYHLSGQKINEAINQSWNNLQGAWANFKTAQERLPSGDIGTTITRERWLLPLFRELEYGRLQSASSTDFLIEGKNYPVSHKTPEGAPIHLVSYQLDLDRRAPGVAGASSASPHSLVQVLLNRSEAHLWGFVSNGYRLRILRDNASLTRQAYVEFDLQAMMDGEVYSDFALLWLLCHQSRIENGRDCWLEGWAKAAREQGTRALDQLRDGVQAAIEALGVGFLDHPANMALRDKLEKGTLDKQDYYRQLLRLVYRLLFLFAAEDRGLLYDPAAPDSARQLYTQHYSTGRLRRIAEKLKGTRHHDLFEALRLVMHLLGGDEGRASGLGLPVLGSFLFSESAIPDIIHARIANVHLLDAVRALAFRVDRTVGKLRAVDYKNLGAEELGSVYESLLELHPQINVAAKTFSLGTAGGNERKTTGSYYTPTSLINALLDSALNPVITDALNRQDGKSAEERLLDLKICDPACGSGHFLIAAAHRVARALAQVRTGEEEPAPAATRAALRDVIGHCIYGVDINPMAVELCKVNLWMEALEPGKPLSFLDHRIQVGNSLLGTTPALMVGGIPDDAFNPIEGDDKADASRLKKLNRQERKDRETGQRSLFELVEPPADYRAIAAAAQRLDDLPDDTLAAVRAKEQAYADLAGDPERQKAQILADAWCAAFVWDKGAAESLPPMTDLQYKNLQRDALDPRFEAARRYVESLKEGYQFFHWHVAFSEVFTVDTRALIGEEGQGITGWNGGFDCVLGNPPWDKIQIEEKKFFAATHSEIANSSATKRKRLIEELAKTDNSKYQAYKGALRKTLGETHFLRAAGIFPLTGKGNVSTHSLFIELSSFVSNPNARVGLIVPSGLVTQDSQKELYESLLTSNRLIAFYDFENREKLFSAIDSRLKFSIVILGNSSQLAQYAFYLSNTEELKETDRIFSLSYSDLRRISPNTLSCPMLRSRGEIGIINTIYENSTIIYSEQLDINPWGINSWQMFNETHEAYLLQLWDEEWSEKRLERHYEAKLLHQFDHRYATYDSTGISTHVEAISTKDKRNPNFLTATEYVIDARIWDERVISKGYLQAWIIAFRKITNATNERTAIFSVIPKSITGSQTPVLISDKPTPLVSAFLANLNAYGFDFVARRKVGATDLNHFILHQLPVIPPHTYTAESLNFIVPRVLELTYTAWDLLPFAQDVGYDGPPFIWDEERRFLMRCELDALYFHLYHISRDDAAYILDTFPIVKRKDEAAHGEYRTKRVILEMYDQMAALPKMHVPAPKGEGDYSVPDVSRWGTWLEPGPGDARVGHKA